MRKTAMDENPPAEDMRRWIVADGMSNLEGFCSLIDDTPADVAALSHIVQGLLVHCDWLPAYGLDQGRAAPISRETLPVAQRLRQAFALDSSPIDAFRPPARRSPATCRDFALMLCSFLRRKNVPARLRCGFAAYFADNWEDHWVCEYWDVRADSWRLADPQIDEVLKARCNIRFDPTNTPREAFLTAGEAWLACRTGKFDFDHFGHGQTTGQWFMHVNVMRDGLALKDILTSPWDEWRRATEPQRRLTDEEVEAVDAWARRPDCLKTGIGPKWLDLEGARTDNEAAAGTPI
jgi:hypothetical protein